MQLLMETVDELGQDTQKFHNYQRNSARQQQQKDAYLMKKVGVKIDGFCILLNFLKQTFFNGPFLELVITSQVHGWKRG